MDRTNVNSGERKGLKRLSQDKVPLLVSIGCENHELALCFKYLMGEYRNINTVNATLLALCKYVHYHPLVLNFLKEAANAYVEHVITPVCPSVTRWTAHGRDFKAVYDGCQQLTVALSVWIEWKMGARSNGPICYPSRRRILDHVSFA